MRDVADRLRAAGVPSPEADARWLLELGLSDDELDALVQRREAREPLQLLLGVWPFREVEVTLRPGVFVPRPETEIVAGVAVDAAVGARLVVDLCTGSGVIAASIAAETDVPAIVATDSSAAAAALARENTAPWAERVDVRVGDLFEPVAELGGRVDVLVANPPYLPPETWEPEVADHDPRDALVAGPDGHEFVDAILEGASSFLRPGGVVVVEIDERRSTEAVARARDCGLVDVGVVPDLAGRPRAVRGRRHG